MVAAPHDSAARTKDKVIISRSRNFIKKNYHQEKLPLRDLAREANTSYFYLCRLFKRELGVTFVQYVALTRVNAALRLLENVNLTIAQVSYAVGITDAQYFDRVFKRTLGCRPKEYRQYSVAKREEIRQEVLAKLL